VIITLHFIDINMIYLFIYRTQPLPAEELVDIKRRFSMSAAVNDLDLINDPQLNLSGSSAVEYTVDYGTTSKKPAKPVPMAAAGRRNSAPANVADIIKGKSEFAILAPHYSGSSKQKSSNDSGKYLGTYCAVIAYFV
jgi:hypothetical protein